MGVFLSALAGIVFQLALTRLCSAALDYHLTFLAVTAAMLGTSAGGVWVAGWLPPGEHVAGDLRHAQRLCLGGAAALALLLSGFAWAPLRTLDSTGALAAMAIGFALAAALYACIGAALALALRGATSRGRTYAADLAGAAAGSLAGLAAMQAWGPPWAGWAATLALLAAGLCFRRPSWPFLAAGVSTVVVAALAAAGEYRPNVLPTKPLAVYLDPVRHPDSEVELTRWDAVSRVDVFRAPGAALLWGPLAGRDAPLPDLLGITIDGDALTAVAQLGRAQRATCNVQSEAACNSSLGSGADSFAGAGDLAAAPGADLPADLPAAGLLPASLPYELAQRMRVLVIGPGGGVDVAAALRYGAERIDAVELNPAVVGVMLGPLQAFSGDLYARPGVRLIHDEGRSYVRRTAQRYDAIVLTAVDSWAALAAGAYSLSESYLYTTEAMGDYYDHLSDGGTLVISRWFTRPPREMERLTALAREALLARGQPTARAVLLQQAGDFGTLLVRRGEFPMSEVVRARAFAQANGFGLAYDPLDHRGTFAGILHTPGGGEPLPSDDRPYFFDFAPWSSLFTGRPAAEPIPRGHAVLLLTLIEGACMVVAGVGLPLRRLRVSLPARAQAGWALYFSLVGIGFMAVEMALVQRFTLLLGYPTVALGVVLGTLLGGGAAGSWLSPVARRRPAVPLLCAAVLLAAYARGLPAALAWALPWSLAGRAGLCVALTLPPAVALGMALPLGLAALPEDPAGVGVPWAWGINGAASAVGATLATMAAMQWGLSTTLAAAAGCYALAAFPIGRCVVRVSCGAAQPRHAPHSAQHDHSALPAVPVAHSSARLARMR